MPNCSPEGGFSPQATADWIHQRIPHPPPRLALVLGSGFDVLSDEVHADAAFAYEELPGFSRPTVNGHRGRLLVGRLGNAPAIVLAGRLHAYEGHNLATITFPIRVLAALGVEAVLLTNAAGGIRTDLLPGDLVVVGDHLNLLAANPLCGDAAHGLPRFIDLSEAYSPGLRELLHQAAADIGAVLKDGVYAMMPGPSYETPAEIRALSVLGADMVGMSTVPEVIVARQCGLQVAALSCITNRAAGLGGRIDHDEVLGMGRRIGPLATRLLSRFASVFNHDGIHHEGARGTEK